MSRTYQCYASDTKLESFPDHPAESEFDAERIFVFVVQVEPPQVRGAGIEGRRVSLFSNRQKPRGSAGFYEFGGYARFQCSDIITGMHGNSAIAVFQTDGRISEPIDTEFVGGKSVLGKSVQGRYEYQQQKGDFFHVRLVFIDGTKVRGLAAKTVDKCPLMKNTALSDVFSDAAEVAGCYAEHGGEVLKRNLLQHMRFLMEHFFIPLFCVEHNQVVSAAIDT